MKYETFFAILCLAEPTIKTLMEETLYFQSVSHSIDGESFTEPSDEYLWGHIRRKKGTILLPGDSTRVSRECSPSREIVTEVKKVFFGDWHVHDVVWVSPLH